MRRRFTVLFVLTALMMSALVGPLVSTAMADQAKATPVVEVTPLPTSATEVPSDLHPLWKAEASLNKAFAWEFCMSPAAQGVIKLNLSNGQSLNASAIAWIQASGGVNPMVLSAAQDYVAAYTAVTKSGPAPEWAYPLAADGGVPPDKVIEQLSQTQYKGCDLGLYGQHA